LALIKNNYYIIQEIFLNTYYYYVQGLGADIATLCAYPSHNEYRCYIYSSKNDYTFITLNDAQAFLRNELAAKNYYELPDELKILL
jgi:hypothetical protein